MGIFDTLIAIDQRRKKQLQQEAVPQIPIQPAQNLLQTLQGIQTVGQPQPQISSPFMALQRALQQQIQTPQAEVPQVPQVQMPQAAPGIPGMGTLMAGAMGAGMPTAQQAPQQSLVEMLKQVSGIVPIKEQEAQKTEAIRNLTPEQRKTIAGPTQTFAGPGEIKRENLGAVVPRDIQRDSMAEYDEQGRRKREWRDQDGKVHVEWVKDQERLTKESIDAENRAFIEWTYYLQMQGQIPAAFTNISADQKRLIEQTPADTVTGLAHALATEARVFPVWPEGLKPPDESIQKAADNLSKDMEAMKQKEISAQEALSKSGMISQAQGAAISGQYGQGGLEPFTDPGGLKESLAPEQLAPDLGKRILNLFQIGQSIITNPIAAAVGVPGYEGGVGKALLDAITLKKVASWSDILEEWGVPKDIAGVVGLAGDIFLDLGSLVTFGGDTIIGEMAAKYASMTDAITQLAGRVDIGDALTAALKSGDDINDIVANAKGVLYKVVGNAGEDAASAVAAHRVIDSLDELATLYPKAQKRLGELTGKAVTELAPTKAGKAALEQIGAVTVKPFWSSKAGANLVTGKPLYEGMENLAAKVRKQPLVEEVSSKLGLEYGAPALAKEAKAFRRQFEAGLEQTRMDVARQWIKETEGIGDINDRRFYEFGESPQLAKNGIPREIQDVIDWAAKRDDELFDELTAAGFNIQKMEITPVGPVRHFPRGIDVTLPEGSKAARKAREGLPLPEGAYAKQRLHRGTVMEEIEAGVPFEESLPKQMLVRELEAKTDLYKANELKTLADDVGVWSERKIKGYKALTLPDYAKGILGDNAGMKLYLPDEYFGDIQSFVTNSWKSMDEPNIIWRGLQNSLQWWKTTATAWRPGFHSRNFLSNYYNLYLMDGTKVFEKRYFDLAHDIKKLAKNPELGAKTFVTSTGKTFTLREIADGSFTRGVSGHGFFGAGEAGGARGLSGLAEMLEKSGDKKTAEALRAAFGGELVTKGARFNPFNPDFAYTTAMRHFGESIEEHARLVGFLVELEKHGNMDLAAEKVFKFLFDYNDLSQWEKTWARKIMPFWTWRRKNLPLQLAYMFKQPGKFGALLDIKEFSENMADVTPEMEEARPSGGLGAYLPFKFGGNPLYYRPDLPFQEPFEAANWRSDVSMLSPLLKIPEEGLLSKRSLYSGKPIRDWRKWGMQQIPALQNIGDVGNVFEEGKSFKETLPFDLARVLGGVNVKPVNIQQALQYATSNVPGKLPELTSSTEPGFAGTPSDADITTAKDNLKDRGGNERGTTAYPKLQRLDDLLKIREQNLSQGKEFSPKLIDEMNTIVADALAPSPWHDLGKSFEETPTAIEQTGIIYNTLETAGVPSGEAQQVIKDMGATPIDQKSAGIVRSLFPRVTQADDLAVIQNNFAASPQPGSPVSQQSFDYSLMGSNIASILQSGNPAALEELNVLLKERARNGDMGPESIISSGKISKKATPERLAFERVIRALDIAVSIGKLTNPDKIGETSQADYQKAQNNINESFENLMIIAGAQGGGAGGGGGYGGGGGGGGTKASASKVKKTVTSVPTGTSSLLKKLMALDEQFNKEMIQQQGKGVTRSQQRPYAPQQLAQLEALLKRRIK